MKKLSELLRQAFGKPGGTQGTPAAGLPDQPVSEKAVCNMNERTREMIALLDCPCEVFAPMDDDGPLMDAYRAARAQGEREGFIPLLLVAEDNLLETIQWASGTWNKDDPQDVNMQRLRSWRRGQLEMALEDGKRLLQSYWGRRAEDLEDDDEGKVWWAQVTKVDTSPGRPLPPQSPQKNRFTGYWDYHGQETNEIILAKIPVKNPWEVFAWVPMGGWNECPSHEEMMAIFKYWYETYQAAPAVVTADIVEASVERPPHGWEQAARLAAEQYAFCCDIVDQGVETVDALAAHLHDARCWYFWWD